MFLNLAAYYYNDALETFTVDVIVHTGEFRVKVMQGCANKAERVLTCS